MQIFPMVVDLSHWDPAHDYGQVKAAGIHGVIYKATEGSGYTDNTYVSQQKAAKAAGLLWGAYHFGDGSSVQSQVDNFMRFACPDPDELFCLDWEDNPGGKGKMSVAMAEQWVSKVENALNRPGQCVIYSGNTAKELLGNSVNEFFGSRRLWLCHYTSGTPKWQKSWESYWLWQFTDGQVGPQPHSIKGIGPCDINSYDKDGGAVQLAKEWASGTIVVPQPPEPPTPPEPPKPTPREVVDIVISAPEGVDVKVRMVTQAQATQARETLRAARATEG